MLTFIAISFLLILLIGGIIAFVAYKTAPMRRLRRQQQQQWRL